MPVSAALPNHLCTPQLLRYCHPVKACSRQSHGADAPQGGMQENQSVFFLDHPEFENKK